MSLQAGDTGWLLLVPALLLWLRNDLHIQLEQAQGRSLAGEAALTLLPGCPGDTAQTPPSKASQTQRQQHNPRYKLITGTGSIRDTNSIIQQACSSSGIQVRGFPATDQFLTTAEYLLLPLSKAPECFKEEGKHAYAWKSTLTLINGMQLNFNVLSCKPLPQIARGCATN